MSLTGQLGTGQPYKYRWQLSIAAVLLHILAFAVIAITMPIRDPALSTINIYMDYGSRFLAGQVPFRDFQFEYPPLAAPLFALPAIFGHDLDSYRVAFALLMLAVDLVGVTARLWAVERLSPRISPMGILAVEPLLLVAAGRMIVFERFDLIAAVLMSLSILLVAIGHERWGWTLLGLGTAVKLYPIVAVPIFLIWQRRISKRELVVEGALFSAAILLPSLITMRGDLSAVSGFLTYHAQRGLEIGTTYTTLVFGEKLLGLTGSAYVGQQFGHGASELIAPQAALFAKLALPLTAVALLGLYFIAWRRRQNDSEQVDSLTDLINFSLLATLAFMLAGKVLSPQYLIWLIPLAGILIRWRGEVWAGLGVALLLTRWIYPDNWYALMSFTPLAMIVLILRNGILLELAFGLLLTYLAALRPAWLRLAPRTGPAKNYTRNWPLSHR